jgi:hypothetical protein
MAFQDKQGIYDLNINNKKNMVFTKNWIIGLFHIKNSEDTSLRLVKVNIK